MSVIISESYVWDSASCGPNITVFEKRPYIAKRMVAKQSTDGARGTHGFTKGRHTFRFKFNDKPWGSNCSIGMCTADTSLHRKGLKYCSHIAIMQGFMVKFKNTFLT